MSDPIEDLFAPEMDDERALGVDQPAPAGDDELREAEAVLFGWVSDPYVERVMAEYDRRGAIERRARAVRDGRADDFLFGDGATAELVVEVARHILGER